MVNRDIFLGSGASLTLVPELDFKITSQATPQTNDVSVQLNTSSMAHFSLLTNLYEGCILEFYDGSNVLVSTHRVVSNSDSTLNFTPKVSKAGGTLTSHYYVLKSYGAPLPAPRVAGGSSSLAQPTITNAGTQILATSSILDNTEINAVSGISGGSNGEIELTLSAHATQMTFATVAADNYENGAGNADGFITLFIAGLGGTERIAVIFNDASHSATSTSADRDITITVTTGDDGSTVAEAVRLALANEDLTITRAANVLTITNSIGGFVTNSAEDTNGGVTLDSNTAGGVITAVTVNNAGSGYSGSGTATIASNGQDGQIAITLTSTTATKRLLADNWLGLLETGTFPNVEVEMKQMNLSLGGSRNWTYQYKGTENATGGSLAFVLTHPTWFYYFLGSCETITGSNIIGTNNANLNANGLQTSNADTNNKFLIDNAAFLAQGPIIYRTVGDKIVPPLMATDAHNAMDIVAVPTNSGTSDLLTYTFKEVEGDILPSFALEQSISKLDGAVANHYKTGTDTYEDNNFVRIARGNMVNDISLTANENEEVKMTMNLNTRNVHLPNTDAVFEARNGQATNTSLINYNTEQESFNEPYFYSGGSFSIFGQNFLKITSFTLNMNNSLEDKRFLGSQSKSIKDAIPAQRTYEISFTALITDNRLFRELLDNTDTAEQTAGNNDIILTFTKQGNANETFTITLTDYLLSSANVTIPDNKGAVTIEATVMPRKCSSIVATTNWILQG